MLDVNSISIRVDGERLMVALAEHGGVYACARKANLSPVTIYQWMRGDRSPRLDEWSRLMAVLGEDLPFCVRQIEGI
jgi:hypothetical protein